MNKLVETFRNIFAIEDLRARILNTFLFLAVFRLGSYIVLPGVNSALLEKPTSGIFGLLDTFLGGAFSNASIFGLGIMPYISASIFIQLLTVAVPTIQKMQREGESGRKKLNQWTRLLTIAITLGQSVGYIATTIPKEAVFPEFSGALFTISSMLCLTAGTIFCMWMGEKITEKGIGNGISMLIMIGIISRLPGAIIKEGGSRGMDGALIFILEIVVLFFVVMGVVMLTQAVRRVPLQYARQAVTSRNAQGGARQYIPLKLNSAGVMPIIFAQSIMFLPAMFVNFAGQESDVAASIGATFSDIGSWQYNLLFAVLIILFTYFYTAISVNSQQIAEELKRNNGFVPGVKPGEETAHYLDMIIDRITLPGALFLIAIAIMPALATQAGVTRDFAQFFGGTSLLIMVGVILDTLQQIQSYLLMKDYEGMMKTGKFSDEPQNMAFAS
jgi:preprotein translocase subunit SecY